MSPTPTLALAALAAVLALVGCGAGGSKPAATSAPGRRGGAGRRSRGAAQPSRSSLPYEQNLLPFHAAPPSPAQRRDLVKSGETRIPVRLKKPGTVSAFGQAQLGLSIVRVANATPVESAGPGTATLDLRLTARARMLLANGRPMLMYVAIKFSGSRTRQQLTVPLNG